MSIFELIADLFRDRRFYRQHEVPADLPVEQWAIFYDPDIGSAVRKFISATPWSEMDADFRQIKVYSECSADNPMVVCLVDSLGRNKRVIGIPKNKFVDEFGKIREVNDLELAEWINEMYEKNQELLMALRAVSRSLQGILDDPRRQ